MKKLALVVAKYIFLVVTFGAMLAIILHSWFVKDSSRPTYVIAALCGLALIPIVSRAKLFDWVEFNQSVKDIQGEMAQVKQQVKSLNETVVKTSASVNNNIAPKLEQTQINIVVDSVRAAKEAAEKISNTDEGRSSLPKTMQDLNLSLEVRSTITFHTRLEKIFDGIRTNLRHIYVFSEVRTSRKLPKNDLNLKLEDLISYFQKKGGLVGSLLDGSSNADDLKMFEKLTELMKLKQSYADSGAFVDVKECATKIREAEMVAAHVYGNTNALAITASVLLRVPDTDVKSSTGHGDTKNGDTS